MKIATLGTGNMARTLGTLWAEAGHEVFFGSREPKRGTDLAAAVGRGTRGGDNEGATAFGEVVLYTGYHDRPSALLSSSEALSGKVLIDCNNSPIPPDFDYEPVRVSIAERVARDVPRARVVKAFNTTPQEIYEHAPETLRAYGVTCFVCGDDAGAKAAVMGLAEELGLEPLDCGPLRRARLIEGLADFVRYAIGGLGLGFQTALSVGSLPETRSERLGGRREPASR